MVSSAQQVVKSVEGYAELPDQASRTTARAQVLHLLDELALTPSDRLKTWRVTPVMLAADPVLRGAIVMHLDLVFRSSVSPGEVAFTAEHGIVQVSEHPELAGVPVAVVLGTPADRLLERRDQLFAPPPRDFPDADVIMPYALAASPRGLGAGRRLLIELVRECGVLARPPRITTFSPLTGLRARVIRCVDDPGEWTRVLDDERVDAGLLRDQLLDLLGCERAPAELPEPARGWIEREAMAFAAAEDYQVGRFHRSMGASLAGVLEAADPYDSDALWWRAWFDYGRADPAFAT